MTRNKDLAQTPLEQRTLLAVLRGVLDQNPDKIAVADATRQLSYGEMWEEACRTAGGLRAQGIGREDRVVLLLENHADSVVTWVALCMIGAVEAPINNSYMGEMLAYVIGDSGAAVAVVDSTFLPNVAEIASQVPRIGAIVVRGDFHEAQSELSGQRRSIWWRSGTWPGTRRSPRWRLLRGIWRRSSTHRGPPVAPRVSSLRTPTHGTTPAR